MGERGLEATFCPGVRHRRGTRTATGRELAPTMGRGGWRAAGVGRPPSDWTSAIRAQGTPTRRASSRPTSAEESSPSWDAAAPCCRRHSFGLEASDSPTSARRTRTTRRRSRSQSRRELRLTRGRAAWTPPTKSASGSGVGLRPDGSDRTGGSRRRRRAAWPSNGRLRGSCGLCLKRIVRISYTSFSEMTVEARMW